MNHESASAMTAATHEGPFNDHEWAGIFATLKLSAQQQRILKLMARGLADKQIVTELRMSYGTLRTHVSRMFARLGVSDRAELLLRVVNTFRCGCHGCARRRPR